MQKKKDENVGGEKKLEKRRDEKNEQPKSGKGYVHRKIKKRQEEN